MHIKRDSVEHLIDKMFKPATAVRMKSYLRRAEKMLSQGKDMGGVYRGLVDSAKNEQKKRRR
jgi:hypothetical protein